MSKIIRDEEKIEAILNRGVEDVIEKEHLRKALLSGKQLRVKLGFDPTGPKIHIGRAIVLRKLRAFQDLGHKVVFIVGDFTAQIGDPSDKLDKRPKLDLSKIKENLQNYKEQVGKIVDLSQTEFKYNSKWLKKLKLAEFMQLQDSFTVGQMLARRNFKERFESGGEIGVKEFSYPLMQGYDSVMVKADLELGGFDQLFNLQAGRVIQKHFGQEPQDVLTVQMLEGTDGRKMSTSWGNVINITDEAKDMFGKLMSVKDELVEKYFRLCTDLDELKIAKEMEKHPKERKLVLASEVVTIYHSKAEAEEAKEEFEKQFAKGELPSEIKTISGCESKMNIVDILLKMDGVESKSEAMRLIEQGGVKVGGELVKSADLEVEIGNGILVQVGKRRVNKFTS